ncbi:phosphate acetyltransferase [Sinobacterium caligoides]|uniref:Phosphate acetyltransferase n=1 Tax=Sinobacterium caligoides TaxID=933926 RepID=A0A3N2DFZ2_9GAMM|nr:phosphate acetyltransferase [Sinobacterium caligoides]ROR98713.1 phosphate acetyltransferase [Sinobacterium caligoides]
MQHTYLLSPLGASTGASSIAMGLMHLADQRGLKAGFFLPVSQSVQSLSASFGSKPAMGMEQLQQYMSDGELDDALELMVASYEEQAADCDIVIVLGLASNDATPFATKVNSALAKSLDASVILVATDTEVNPQHMNRKLEIAAETYGGAIHGRALGVVINKAGAPRDVHGTIRPEMFDTQGREIPSLEALEKQLPIFRGGHFKLFGIIPWQSRLMAPRTIDINRVLPVQILHKGQAESRRIEHVSIGARSPGNLVEVLQPGTLVVTSGDRNDVLQAAALAEISGNPLAGVLLTGGLQPSEGTMKLIAPALELGLPVMVTKTATYPTATRLPALYPYTPEDDTERFASIIDHVVAHLQREKFREVISVEGERRLSPAAFRYNLVRVAKALKKTVVLPEGDEPRTVEAAIISANKGIAHCQLLADPAVIDDLLEKRGWSRPEQNFEVIDPRTIRNNYINSFVELRKHKGMNEVRARQLLEDSVVLGTMMLEQNDVDGLVSGAVHTTANTILPALQLIKTKPDASLVSSVFFMCLPDQVMVYGDCAVNPDPDAQQLADIAIQSADSAAAFGIPPRVAMISYSTGSSGSGADVEKVREATRIAKELRPDLVIDGPLQYDAATTASVAASKAPDSPVAGKATVIIFPDLNTGNTTYKAVQRSASVVSVGPMLQGLKKPVNDLSRGALVDDIVYTIALTAIQSGSEGELEK